MDIQKYMKEFNKSERNPYFSSDKYHKFTQYINSYYSGEGMVGSNSYLILWEKDDIEELNDIYEVNEYLNGCMLIGSDGGDMAYGIRDDGIFFTIPFIGMSDEEIITMGEDFTEFIRTMYLK